jgi:CheY-like chemotaxis protein
MLTVRDTEDDKVQALAAGADDYITKPFRLRELIARMGAVRRRTSAGDVTRSSIMRAGRIELKLEGRILKKDGQEIHLTPKEFDLLAFLMQRKDVPLTHARLPHAIWGAEYGNESHYVRSYIKTLRRKIEDDPGRPEYILTECHHSADSIGCRGLVTVGGIRMNGIRLVSARLSIRKKTKTISNCSGDVTHSPLPPSSPACAGPPGSGGIRRGSLVHGQVRPAFLAAYSRTSWIAFLLSRPSSRVTLPEELRAP